MKFTPFMLFLLLCTCQFPGFTAAAVTMESESVPLNKSDQYIRFVYEQLDFSKVKKLHYEAFNKAYHGYLNLREAGRIQPNALLTVCDFSLSSNVKRMWVIDLQKKKILFNTLVAHGQGTGEEFAEHFSNTPESHQSSLGFYVTGETYTGNNGYSLKLHGEDGNFNSNAYDRAIVIHAAEYVCDDFAKNHKRIGRSHGCPALPVDIAPKVIDQIKNGHCLFIYYPSKQYLASSRWISNPVQQLPEEANLMDLRLPEKNRSANFSMSSHSETRSAANPSAPESVCDELPCEEKISGGDRQNYKVEVTTILVKKNDRKKAGLQPAAASGK